MQWIINKQIAVEADTPEEAVAKINEGKTISFSVLQRSDTQLGTIRSNVQSVGVPAGTQIIGATKSA